jgi:hypothetical protein
VLLQCADFAYRNELRVFVVEFADFILQLGQNPHLNSGKPETVRTPGRHRFLISGFPAGQIRIVVPRFADRLRYPEIAPSRTILIKMMPDSDAQRDWRTLYPFADHWLELDHGNRLHYVDEGRGTAVVMLHGNPTWSFYYRGLICGLRNSCRTVVPDHLGCGLSDKPQDYAYCLENHIRNLERLLLDTLRLDHITLVVHDWGGAIGMGFATRHPEKIARVVVLNTAAFLLPDCPWRIRICRLPGFGTLALRGLNAFSRAALHMGVCQPKP